MFSQVRTKLLALILVVSSPVVISAYTIVMRDGRRIEVPNNFTVSQSTLTYEAGVGIQVTLQLSTINITATELANNETNGALLGRAVVKTSANQPVVASRSGSGRAITNADLERFRLTRVASERAYEQRRKELGLPSLAESRREILNVGERAQAQLLKARSEEQQSENYWRNRASTLRLQVNETNARIGFVQARLNEIPLNYAYGGVISSAPFRIDTSNPSFGVVDQMARGAVLQSPVFSNRHRFSQPTFSARIGFGNTNVRGRVLTNASPRPGFGRRHHFPNRFPFGNVAVPFAAYDNSWERSELLTELDQLLAERAGLQARWRELEDEARRNGAYPGWLR